MGQPTAAAEHAGRDRQIRVVAERRRTTTMSDALEVVWQVLGEAWQVERLVRSGRQVLVWTDGNHPVGTDAHARASHEAALTLSETDRFTKVEADVPIRGYAENLGPATTMAAVPE